MKTGQIARTLLAGAAVAIAGAVLVYFVFPEIGFGRLILSALAGYGAGTFIHRAGGRNGGPFAMTVASVAVVLAFLPALLIPALGGGFPVSLLLPTLVTLGFAIYNSR